jgi:hypothetical protein
VGLRRLELIIRASCVDGSNDILPDREYEGIHGYFIENFERIGGHKGIRFSARAGFGIVVDAKSSHMSRWSNKHRWMSITVVV